MGRRLVRLIRVLRVLEAAKPMSVDALSDQLGVSRRTAFRDLEALREAGFRIDFDHSRRIYKMRSGEAPAPKKPSARDLAELLLQAAATSLPRTYEQRRQAARAARVLSAGLPVELKRVCVAMQDSVARAEQLQGTSGPRQKVDRILDALADSKCVLVVVLVPDESSEEDSWVTRPLQIVLDGDRWLLEGVVHPCGRSLLADFSKVAIELTDSMPPLTMSSNMHHAEHRVEIV